MTFIPNKPAHNRYAFRNLTDTDYRTYAKEYLKAKAHGIRGIYAWASGAGAGIISVVKGVSKGVVVDYSKRKLAGFCLSVGAWVSSPALVIFTNSSKIVKLCKRVHSTVSFGFECIEDSSNLVLLRLDCALFGQPILTGPSNRFNFLTNHTDFLDDFID